MGVGKVILHIGSDKAGSTAIQESLSANRDWYRLHGFYVPEAGFLKRAGHANLFQNIENLSLRRNLANEIREVDDVHTAILSWEGVHFFGGDQRRELRSLLEVCFPGSASEIVYYVRNQLSLIQSGLLQQVKQLAIEPQTIERVSTPFNEIPEHLKPLLLNDQRRFKERIDAWQCDFPATLFNIRMYDRSVLVAGDIIDDFHSSIGIELNEGFRHPTSFANQSLTAETAVVLAELFRFVWNRDDQHRLVDTILSFREGTSSYLHESTQQAILDHFEKDNRALASAFPICGPMTGRSVVPTTTIDRGVVEGCRAFMVEQAQFPTLIIGSLRGTELVHLNLVDGWAGVNHRGSWAIGDRSLIRFRPRSMHFGGLTPGMTINLSGKYQGRRSASDDVVINGHSLGKIDVFSHEIFIPTDWLDDTFRVEIEFRHTDRRPRSDPDPRRRFRFDGLDYSVLHRPS